MPFMDRENFIDLLNRLGDEDDQVVLAAARTIHARVAESGFGWDGLLLPAGARSDQPIPPPAIAAPPDVDETDAALIDRLLRDYALSDMTRGDLLEMKAQAEHGSLPAEDSKYLRDLALRLAQAGP
ncbi:MULTISPECIES: hypothetical protein [unclassified Azospirillum]|uniref:hypothetical protein n=1 Tax=unclassified Azospirillum TaxID=2630922 RepID=UPI000B72FF61|nr:MULTISPECIES: hypothetical protein [unclassified Azospirillum]SNS26141.1 hypothetical protein SAMN05880556_103212 [Azospirillum sp. RU38E]SNS44614.1 hypothetical protein SAMN05880591_103212 [Azospirillum sp. RU37A]